VKLKLGDPSTWVIRGRRFDPVAAVLFTIGVLLLILVSRLDLMKQDANWDLLNYHAYVPYSLFSGTWFKDFHPAGMQTYLTPYQDLLLWPLVSGVDARIATYVLVVIQISIFVPLGLILQTVVPSLSRSRALAVGLIGVSGAMTMTELGGTMGDIPPAIAVAWALYLLLSVLAGQTTGAYRRAALGGVLIGVAVALKYTVLYIAPGLLAVVFVMTLAGKWRSAWLFILTAMVATVLLLAPWAILLQINMGSPIFPLYNSIFQAPRFPAIDFHDPRFPVTSLGDMVNLPIRQAMGTAYTAESPFTDVRWLIAVLVAGVGIGAAALRLFRRADDSSRHAILPGMALLLFWCVSYVVWAHEFGIQRYAVLLEVLALPVVVVGASLAWSRLPSSRTLLPMLVVVALLFAKTTTIVDFGRRPMGSTPIVPSKTIQPLARYDVVVIGAGPLSFLRAVTRDAPGSADQVWLGGPFNERDIVLAKELLAGRSVGVVFYPNLRDSASSTASNLGLRLTPDCASFKNPLANSNGSQTTIVICAAAPTSGTQSPTPQSATALSVYVSTNPWPAGSTHSVKVTALDADGNVAVGYTGTIHFTTSDPSGDVPVDYEFTAADKGVHSFIYSVKPILTLRTVGTQWVRATDTAHSTITGAMEGIVVS
jgi:hypothetical protein